MTKLVDMNEWKRARLGRGGPICRRARPTRWREDTNGFRGIGDVSFELLRKLRQE